MEADSFMITEASRGGDFFDVSEASGRRPEPVEILGGGVETFLGFFRQAGGGLNLSKKCHLLTII